MANNPGTPPPIRRYLQQQQLETLFRDMLAALLYSRPARPLEFMIAALQEIQNKQDRNEAYTNQDVFRRQGALFGSAGDGMTDKSANSNNNASHDQHHTGNDDDSVDDNEEDTFDAEENNANNGLSSRFQKAQEQAANFSRIRRGSVSAESLKPSEDNSNRVIVPKSDEARMRIAASISNNLLFRNLEPDQRREVVDAMFEKQVPAGTSIIKQGDEGDNFYVVDRGHFDVFVKGVKVVDIGPGGSFGELALMYNTPRAATVTATEDSVLWAVDRVTFRRSITNNTFRKRKLYESFLKTVPILQSLEPAEIVKVADALEPVEYDSEDVIVEQGDHGDSFYILVEGSAVVTKIAEAPSGTLSDINANAEPVEVMRLKPGDYFGEIALLTDQPRAATVTALEHVKCVSLDTKAFIRLLGPIMDILKRNLANYQKYQEYM